MIPFEHLTNIDSQSSDIFPSRINTSNRIQHWNSNTNFTDQMGAINRTSINNRHNWIQIDRSHLTIDAQSDKQSRRDHPTTKLLGRINRNCGQISGRSKNGEAVPRADGNSKRNITRFFLQWLGMERAALHHRNKDKRDVIKPANVRTKIPCRLIYIITPVRKPHQSYSRGPHTT